MRAGGGGGGGDDDGVDEAVMGVEDGAGVCPVALTFANGDGVLGPTMASDRGRAGVDLDLVEVGEVMVPSRTCRVPPSTLICRYPLLLSLMSLISPLSLSAMLIPRLSSSSDEEDAPSVSEKPSLLLSSSSEELSSSSLNSSTDIMELLPWSITILALSTDRAAAGRLVVDAPSSFFLVGVDDDAKSAMAAAAAASGEGPPAASAPLFLVLGGVGVMFVGEIRRRFYLTLRRYISDWIDVV